MQQRFCHAATQLRSRCSDMHGLSPMLLGMPSICTSEGFGLHPTSIDWQDHFKHPARTVLGTCHSHTAGATASKARQLYEGQGRPGYWLHSSPTMRDTIEATCMFDTLAYHISTNARLPPHPLTAPPISDSCHPWACSIARGCCPATTMLSSSRSSTISEGGVRARAENGVPF